MNRSAALALAAAAILVGCPVPQPLPEYKGGAVTPPRIVVDDSSTVNQIAYPGTIVPVPVQPGGCATKPTFRLDAQIRDANPNLESITARWFVNYDPASSSDSVVQWQETVSPAPTDSTLRDLTPWTFVPHDYPLVGDGGAAGETVGGIHVVELVVSNGFLPDTGPGQPWSPGDPLPNRSPLPGFEVQVYRWVFLNVAASPTPCDPLNTLCAVCPSP